MKYTKYQYKKKNNKSNFLVSLIMTLVAAIVVGLVLFKVIVTFIVPLGEETKATSNPSEALSSTDENEEVAKDETNEVDKKNDTDNDKINESKDVLSGEVIFQLVQCGYFGEEKNALDTLSKIESDYNAFVVKEEDKFRVSAGIFEQEKGESISKELTEKGISNTKVSFILNMSNDIESQIAGITEAYLNIINTLNDDDVKSVDTAGFKAWVNELDSIGEGESVELLSSYKNHVNQLNDEVMREDMGKELEFIYITLSKFKA